jgi:hypothetical protein
MFFLWKIPAKVGKRILDDVMTLCFQSHIKPMGKWCIMMGHDACVKKCRLRDQKSHSVKRQKEIEGHVVEKVRQKCTKVPCYVYGEIK